MRYLNRPVKGSYQPLVETLEDRCLLSAALALDINTEQAGGADPENLVNVNGTLFFTASTPRFGTELWKSDGTPEGTSMVKDINPGSASTFRSGIDASLTNVNGTLYFVATL